jgi:hypothetical protein
LFWNIPTMKIQLSFDFITILAWHSDLLRSVMSDDFVVFSSYSTLYLYGWSDIYMLVPVFNDKNLKWKIDWRANLFGSNENKYRNDIDRSRWSIRIYVCMCIVLICTRLEAERWLTSYRSYFHINNGSHVCPSMDSSYY